MFEAYITNTALYPLMGIEVGTTVHFPMTTQELQAALAKIGIDGKRYSEVFFTSFDSDVLGLYDYLYECENIDELNELGHALLEVRDKGGLETFVCHPSDGLQPQTVVIACHAVGHELMPHEVHIFIINLVGEHPYAATHSSSTSSTVIFLAGSWKRSK